ncbi:MAG: glucans biosynthesis glucosyltransferase MdoH [Parvibaculaceae bacterium]
MDKVIEITATVDDFVPSENRLEMPVQSLTAWPGGARDAGRCGAKTAFARWFVFPATIALTGLGTYEIYQVVSPAGLTWLQVVFAALFAVTFAWISFACISAILGFFTRGVMARKNQNAAHGRTALVMPVYHEDPENVADTLRRMAAELCDIEAHRRFDIFVLSDSREALHARREAQAFHKLRRDLAGRVAVYYRRRSDNHHKKAGNIADFVTRWGGAYEHMVVLDADSYMTAETLVALADAMDADPKAGIIQSLPFLHGRWTLYARMQQFAGRVYGPLVANGLSTWHGRDGNFWGHNAIIRVKAFAESAGLPELPGRKPFGGHILSHDFIEAALLRRAGWAVYMIPSLGGSYEEPPPNLVELASRDRRWAQGNLQHMKIVTAAGLHWVSRIHLIQGIMSYLASPLWLLLLTTGLVLSTVAKYAQTDYFPEGFSLFPTWPVFDPERALRLFGLTMIVLFLPKILAIIAAMGNRTLRRGCGGASGLLTSFVVESLLSALLSPVMMLIQTRFVADIFLGRDSGWKAQNRDGESPPLGRLMLRHSGHVAIGLAVGVVAFLISDDTFLWLSPIIAGLVLSGFVSWLTGLTATGKWAWRRNIFRIPEEAEQPSVGAQNDNTPNDERLAAAE